MTFSDISDEASALESLNIEIALSNRRKPEMKFTGRCYYCGEVIPKANFCDDGCRHDYEMIEHANKHRRVA